MKTHCIFRLFTIAFLIFSMQSASFAAEKKQAKPELKRVCGVEFGAVCRVVNHPRNQTYRYLSGREKTAYYFVPEKKFDNFQNYYLWVTPKNKKVYAISMTADFKSSQEAMRFFDKICVVLEKHYKVKPKEVFAMKTKTLLFKLDNGEILLEIDSGFGSYEVSVKMEHTELAASCEAEEKVLAREAAEKAAEKVDTSALE